jgi:hypothetical protein
MDSRSPIPAPSTPPSPMNRDHDSPGIGAVASALSAAPTAAILRSIRAGSGGFTHAEVAGAADPIFGIASPPPVSLP